MRKAKDDVINIKEEVKIGNVILEAGDKIKILKENNNLSPRIEAEIRELVQVDLYNIWQKIMIESGETPSFTGQMLLYELEDNLNILMPRAFGGKERGSLEVEIRWE